MKHKCKECGKPKDESEMAKHIGITRTGLEYRVWICDNCWYDTENWNN